MKDMKMKFIKIGFSMLISLTFSMYAEAVTIKINVKNEVDLKNGEYLVKEHGGQNRNALINHARGAFEVDDIAVAECSEGYISSKLPLKYNYLKSKLKENDFVFIKCYESTK